jgi:DNA-binding transcriptional MerR regulator
VSTTSVLDDPPVALTIAEVAERTGVTAHTLRYYERIGLLEAHRDRVKERIVELEAALGVVEYKIATYGGTCSA